MKIVTLALAAGLACCGTLAMAQSSMGGTAAGGSSATGGEGAAGKNGGAMNNSTTSGSSGMTSGSSGMTSGSTGGSMSSDTPRINDASKSGAPNASSAEKGTGTPSAR